MTNVDPSNFTIAIIGYIIVFSALLLLAVVFTYIPKIMKMQIRNSMIKKGNATKECKNCGDSISSLESAAISAALYLYFNNQHDYESTKVTIKKVKKDYSPWSSKIYGVSSFHK